MVPGKRRTASQKKKAKVIETTMQLLLRKGGSNSVSTSDVCTAANLTRSSLYHYFGSKTKLMLSVHFSFIEKIMKPYLAEAGSMRDPFDRFTFMVRSFTSDVICRFPELRILIHDEMVIKDKHFREIKAAWKENYLLLRDTIAELQSIGTITTDIKASWAALFVLGMLCWMTYWYDYQQKDQITAMGDAALRMVLEGLAGDGHAHFSARLNSAVS